MITRRYAVLAISAALLLVMSAGAGAQSDPITPESQDWSLTSHQVADELVRVSIGVEATLLLEDGTASGSGGCNTFSGSYLLDGVSLTFGRELASTLMACMGDAGALESAYLSLLPQVAAWSIDDEVLTLAGDDGGVLLTYEVPDIALTRSQLDALMAELQRLRDEIETLRDEMASPAPEASPTPAATATPVAFSRAEQVLLEGIVPRIARTCEPLRKRLPTGTVAAVKCGPSPGTVSEVTFYLMDQGPAADLFSRRMTRNGVRGVNDVGGQCIDGYRAVSDGPGPGSYAEGCFVDSDSLAHVEYLQTPTECKVLRAGGERLATPVAYIAITGKDDNIKRLVKWAQRGTAPYSGRYNQITGLTQEIERPRGAWSPNCPVR